MLDVPICKQCFRRDYTRFGEGFELRKNVVIEEGGSLRRRDEVHELIDPKTGRKIYSRNRYEIRGQGFVSEKTLTSAVESREVIETHRGFYRAGDLVYDDFGRPFPKEYALKYSRKCASCGKAYTVSGGQQTMSETMCFECQVKKGCSCQNCGKPFTPNPQIRSMLMLGIDKYIYGYCPACVEKSLPFVYHGKKEVEGTGRTVGVEVECEPTVGSQLELAMWGDKEHMVTGITDGSLRGKFPCEFVSPILHESNYEWWLGEFGKRLNAVVYMRCGLHIHIGTQEFGWFEMNNLMRYLKKYEQFFFSVVSPSRRLPEVVNGNNAGLPVTLPDIPAFHSREDLLDWCYGRSRVKQSIGSNIHKTKRCNDRGAKYDGNLNRYQWANFHGHWFKGAIEIRIHQGTSNVQKIANWMEFWFNIIPHAALPEEKWKHPLKVIPKHLEVYYLDRIERFKKLAKSGLVQRLQ